MKHFTISGRIPGDDEHLAQLAGRGLISIFTSSVEGYGNLEAMGIKLDIVDVEVES